MDHLFTVEEYWNLADEDESCYHELRHGQLVAVSPPVMKYLVVQLNLRDLLQQVVGGQGSVWRMLTFRALPEYEVRVADVAYLSKYRWESADPDDYVHGAPELVADVITPAHTVLEVFDKEQLCLENGSKEFWLVNLARRKVRVSTPDGLTLTFRAGQQIPLFLRMARRSRWMRSLPDATMFSWQRQLTGWSQWKSSKG